jgi:hypothetical protein
MNDSSDIFYVRELIDALDRRLWPSERPDAITIAREGAALRMRAVRRLTELESRRPALRAR